MTGTPFTHRVYLGWITDLASNPDPHERWPSMRRDSALLLDYERQLDTIAEFGFNALCVWGLAAARDWPLELSEALNPEKRDFAAQLRRLTRERGLQLLAGLGVYSWGFETIIRAHPHLARTNKQALCPHVEESDGWMKRIVDFVLEELELDGVQMQSADQGRCECEECLTWNQLEHHAVLNTRTARYIRSRWPDKIIGVNSWGMNFDQPDILDEALPLLSEMGRHIDYFTGIDDASSATDGAARQKLIDHLPCAVGTIGGTQVEPPQHWERERWFLPLARRTCHHIEDLAAAGGRSCEAFFHIDANPGDELSLWIRCLALQNPETPWEVQLRYAVEKLYEPRSEDGTQQLCSLLARAEEAYFGRAKGLPCRTFSLEPLLSAEVGPPIYLKSLDPAGRASYRRDLLELIPQFLALRESVERKHKIESIVRCLENVIDDINHFSD